MSFVAITLTNINSLLLKLIQFKVNFLVSFMESPKIGTQCAGLLIPLQVR